MFGCDGDGISCGDGKTEPDEEQDGTVHDVASGDGKPEEDRSENEKEDNEEEGGDIEIYFLDRR